MITAREKRNRQAIQRNNAIQAIKNEIETKIEREPKDFIRIPAPPETIKEPIESWLDALGFTVNYQNGHQFDKPEMIISWGAC